MDNKTMLGAIAVLMLVLGFVGGYFFGLQSAPAPEAETGPAEEPETPAPPVEEEPKLTGTIPIGVVMIGSIAPRELPPLEDWLEEEINDFIKAMGYDFEIDLLYENAERSPDLALEKVQTLHAQGAQVILGMRWSSSIEKSYSYVTQNNIVIISEGSTSPKYAIPGDTVFRLPPNDLLQSKAIISLHKDLGTEAVIILHRGDAWGDGLKEEFTRLAQEAGIEVIDAIRYNPEATEFSGEVASLADKVSQALQQYDKVAIQTFVFDELATILQQAQDYDVLFQVPWIGSDGTSGVDIVVQDAGEQAFQTVQLSTIFAPAQSLKHQQFVERYVRENGFEPGVYTKCFYDSVWLATLSIIAAGEYDGAKIAEKVPMMAELMFGVTGWLLLDETGDRAAAQYSVQMVVETDGGYDWEIVATIDALTGSVSWIQKPDLSRFGW